MQYKTMILELMQERFPELHERLRRSRMLLEAMDRYASELRSRHLEWKEEFLTANPGMDQAQAASLALEMALKDIEERLLSDSWASAIEA